AFEIDQPLPHRVHPAFDPSLPSHALTTEIYSLSLHDALPIFFDLTLFRCDFNFGEFKNRLTDDQLIAFGQLLLRYLFVVYDNARSEEHTSELQSRENLVCRLLLEKTRPTRMLRFRASFRRTSR